MSENFAAMTATYSPEDNKLRLYPARRLDEATFARVKAAGFKWAPRQELFVAPMWTPGREDLLIELCGEIGDEDTSLVDRAEERAERFSEYSDKRASDADAARSAVSAIADGIPLGQPILVGHHSERRARKDAERIENGMRRAVQMWETSDYWKQRAAGALSHAKYKELPAVRHRRMKGLASEMRKQEREKEECQKWLGHWSKDGLTHEQALRIANFCNLSLPRKEGDRPDFDQRPSAYAALSNEYTSLYAPRTVEEVVEHAKKVYPQRIAYIDRWIAHYQNRIDYERAMLDEQGGLKAEAFDIQTGGRVLIGGEWLVIMRINKVAGQIASVTTNARYCRVRGIEEIKDYRAPSEEDAAKVKALTKLPPLVNYPGEGFAHMTQAEFEKIHKDYRVNKKIMATATAGAHRLRRAIGAFIVPSESDMNKRHSYHNVYITDLKRVDPPAPVAGVEPVTFEREREAIPPSATVSAQQKPEGDADFEAMRQQLKTGVQVISAPQLFPTPSSLAARMVELAEIEPGMRVLEPSAGTGRILEQLPEHCEVVAVEISPSLGGRLNTTGRAVVIGDFLECSAESLNGSFDKILMNPPFQNADDIKHIEHALGMLKPGGRLVAICANGPRQNAKLRPLVEKFGGEWEDLPAETFKESGTLVNTALISFTV